MIKNVFSKKNEPLDTQSDIQIQKEIDLNQEKEDIQQFQLDFLRKISGQRKSFQLETSQLNRIISILQFPPENRTKFQINKLLQEIKYLDFFQQYDESVNFNCCRHLYFQEHEKGDTVIKYNTYGDKFYIIIKGSVDVYTKTDQHYIQNNNNNSILHNNSSQQENESNSNHNLSQVNHRGSKTHQNNSHHHHHHYELQKQKSLFQGQSFGELALLSNQLRQASIVCQTKCWFAVLKKPDFDHILKQVEREKIEQQISFLKSISFLHGWSDHHLKQLFLCTQIIQTKKGKIQYKIGDQVDNVYIILKGEFEISLKIEKPKQLIKNDHDILVKAENKGFFKPVNNKNFYLYEKLHPVAIFQQYDIFGEEEYLDYLEKQQQQNCNNLTENKIQQNSQINTNIENNSQQQSVHNTIDINLTNDLKRKYQIVCTSLEGQLLEIQKKDFFKLFINSDINEHFQSIIDRYNTKQEILQQQKQHLQDVFEKHGDFFFKDIQFQEKMKKENLIYHKQQEKVSLNVPPELKQPQILDDPDKSYIMLRNQIKNNIQQQIDSIGNYNSIDNLDEISNDTEPQDQIYKTYYDDQKKKKLNIKKQQLIKQIHDEINIPIKEEEKYHKVIRSQTPQQYLEYIQNRNNYLLQQKIDTTQTDEMRQFFRNRMMQDPSYIKYFKKFYIQQHTIQQGQLTKREKAKQAITHLEDKLQKELKFVIKDIKKNSSNPLDVFQQSLQQTLTENQIKNFQKFAEKSKTDRYKLESNEKIKLDLELQKLVNEQKIFTKQLIAKQKFKTPIKDKKTAYNTTTLTSQSYLDSNSMTNLKNTYNSNNYLDTTQEEKYSEKMDNSNQNQQNDVKDQSENYQNDESYISPDVFQSKIKKNNFQINNTHQSPQMSTKSKFYSQHEEQQQKQAENLKTLSKNQNTQSQKQLLQAKLAKYYQQENTENQNQPQENIKIQLNNNNTNLNKQNYQSMQQQSQYQQKNNIFMQTPQFNTQSQINNNYYNSSKQIQQPNIIISNNFTNNNDQYEAHTPQVRKQNLSLKIKTEPSPQQKKTNYSRTKINQKILKEQESFNNRQLKIIQKNDKLKSDAANFYNFIPMTAYSKERQKIQQNMLKKFPNNIKKRNSQNSSQKSYKKSQNSSQEDIQNINQQIKPPQIQINQNNFQKNQKYNQQIPQIEQQQDFKNSIKQQENYINIGKSASPILKNYKDLYQKYMQTHNNTYQSQNYKNKQNLLNTSKSSNILEIPQQNTFFIPQSYKNQQQLKKKNQNYNPNNSCGIGLINTLNSFSNNNKNTSYNQSNCQ